MKEVLLVVDMQEGFRSPESEKIIRKILDIKNKFSNKVIFTKFVNLKDSNFEEKLGWTKFRDKSEREIFSELKSGDLEAFDHKGYTILDDKLKSFLKKGGIKRVYICGIYTDVCVMKLAMDLFDEGFEVLVVKDACASLHGNEIHNCAIKSLEHILGKDCVISYRKI